jgi:TrmH family RNA methyltransferase
MARRKRKPQSPMDLAFERMAAHTHIVLVRTQGGLNLGSAARAMANFGFASLRLVSPQCEIYGMESRSMAVDAFHIIEAAQLYDDIPSATADCPTVFGTTRRTGRRRRAELSQADMSASLMSAGPDHPAAIVFGNEGSGLSTEELDQCNAIVSVRTRADYNSFNLAQAVLLMLYETHRTFQDTPAHDFTQMQRVEELLGHAQPLLRRSGMLHGTDQRQINTRLRKILVRADLSWREWRMLHALVAHIDKAWDKDINRK